MVGKHKKQCIEWNNVNPKKKTEGIDLAQRPHNF